MLSLFWYFLLISLFPVSNILASYRILTRTQAYNMTEGKPFIYFYLMQHFDHIPQRYSCIEFCYAVALSTQNVQSNVRELIAEHGYTFGLSLTNSLVYHQKNTPRQRTTPSVYAFLLEFFYWDCYFTGLCVDSILVHWIHDLWQNNLNSNGLFIRFFWACNSTRMNFPAQNC